MNVSFSKILEQIPDNPPPLYLHGLRGSSKSLLLKQIQTSLDRPLVVITDTYEKCRKAAQGPKLLSWRRGALFVSTLGRHAL